MRKESVTFRIDEETKTYLIQLMTLEVERATKFGLTPVSRSELLNEAIRNYYFYRMNARDSDPVTENVLKAVEQAIQKNNAVLVNAINSSHYDIRIIEEYARLLCKALNFDEAKDGLEKLLTTEMPWDIAIPEKVDREISMEVKKEYKRGI